MNIAFAPKFYWAANWHLNVEWTTTISHLNVQLTKSICIVTISHQKMNQTKLFQRLCIVTISHQKWICNAFAFFATCSEFCCESVTNKSHFWCENVTNLVPDRYNKKNAKTRCFILQDLVSKHEYLVRIRDLCLLIRTILVQICISFSHYFATQPLAQIRISFLHYFLVQIIFFLFAPF